MMIDRSLNYGREVIKGFLRHCDAPGAILDIGAGKGFDLAIAREVHPKATLYGIEAYPPSVEILKSQGVQVLPLDIERDRFPLPAASLDIVMANQVLEHTKELFWIFHQVTTVLKVGGSFIIGVPNLAALHNRLLLAVGRQPSPIKNHSAHVRGFTRGDLLAFVERAFPGGYALRDFGGSNFYPFPPRLAKPLARLLPSMAWGIFLRLEKIKPYERQFLDYPVREQLETNFYLG